ncbi:MAG: tRNA preQ1(34) S-adenosylmethionine ribosyltransferase-isomerase QueA [Deltaproteobacteria bacterium]|nr:tRNA preQ1(34) S-adenosylmethionine ribosyltransferase-isomerase QueA [Deltaproteobacteria bacterium]
MSFSFVLPDELIAQHPTPKRGESRLLVVSKSRGIISEGIFNQSLPSVLHQGDLIVFNNSRVLKARLILEGARKSVSLLVVGSFEQKEWKALVQGLDSIKSGETFRIGRYEVTFLRREGSFGVFKSTASVREIMDEFGKVPIPPYIRRGQQIEDDEERYQTIYATKSGSIAAPTAGLHFDEKSFEILREQGVEKSFLTLHVGPGAIANYLGVVPEYFEIPEDTLSKLSSYTKRVVAVGTTTIRALETFYRTGLTFGTTDLIISEGFEFGCVHAFFTNFHLPNSSHLSIVTAFLGEEVARDAYEYAVKKKFRFYSYGDAMFCCP